MDTRKFKTKTDFIERNNGVLDDVWEIALDLGYSAVKLFAPNMISRFPSYAKRTNEDFHVLGQIPEEQILYQDLDTGELWIVGETAQALIKNGDTSDSEASLYGRERYGNPMFKVIANVGLGVAMQTNQFGSPENKEIVIQTGLPEKYLKMDKESLVDVLSGNHHFRIKLGNNSWQDFNFTIKPENVFVMSQPMGTLFSVSIGRNGAFIPEANKYLKSNVMVFDPGFGTLDLFPINHGIVGKGETYDDLGMKRVFLELSSRIMEKYKTEVPVPAMQKVLSTGEITVFDRKHMITDKKKIGDLLAESNEKICTEAISRMMSVMDISDCDYLIITGGTGAAWLHMIKERLAGLSTLTIIQGNQNDELPFVYSNVRGYYLFRYNKLLKR